MSNFVTSITLDLTEQCDLRCTYCFTSGKTTNRMSFETAKKAILWLFSKEVSGDEKNIKITFWGGEPLLEFELIKQIVTFVRSIEEDYGKKVKFNMTTNGMNLTEEVIKYLMLHNIGYMISVDGFGERNRYRKTINGDNSFEQVLEKLKLSKSLYPMTNIRLTLTPENAFYMYEDILKFREVVGIDRFHFSPAYEMNWTEQDYKNVEYTLYRLAEEVIRSYKSGKRFRIKPFSYRPTKNAGGYPCGAGHTYLSISTEGAIYPCHRFHDFCDGRVWSEQEKCLGHIDTGITNSEFKAQFDDFPQLLKNYNCAHCGGCYATNFDITGSIFTGTKLQDLIIAWQEDISIKLFEQLKNNMGYLQDYVNQFDFVNMRKEENKNLMSIIEDLRNVPADVAIPRDVTDFLITELYKRIK